jgi:hypothetical protein
MAVWLEMEAADSYRASASMRCFQVWHCRHSELRVQADTSDLE